MWPRFNLDDFRIIGHYLGYLVMFMGLAMIIPLLIAVFQGQPVIATNYMVGMGLALLVGFLLCMLKVGNANLKRKQAVSITALAWIVCSVITAVPLYMSGHFNSFFDVMFEMMSGLTTSGISVCRDIEHMSMADNIWRFIMHFIGGQGIIISALSIVTFARGGSRTNLYDSEGRHDHVMPEIRQSAVFIFRLSMVIVIIGTIAMAVMLMTKGFTPGAAFAHGACMTIASYDTAGFSLTSQGLCYYHSWALDFIFMILMLIGATSLALIGNILNGRVKEFFRNFEVRTFAIWMVALMISFVVFMCLGSYLNGTDTLLRKGVFTVVSAATSTGSMVYTSSQIVYLMTNSAEAVLVVAMAIGGMSESMAGGIKVLRVGIIFKEVVLRIKQVLSPDNARMVATYDSNGKKIVTQSTASAALVVTMLYVATMITGALIFMACGLDPLSAIFDSVSASGNNGLIIGVPSVPGRVMPLAMEITMFIQMWLGRLEFLTVFSFIAVVITSLLPDRRRHKR